MVPSHDGMPDPRGPGTHPGLVCPTSGPAMGGGRGTRIQTPLTRSLRGDRGVSTQRTDVPTRVRGATGDSPITHIRRRLAACAWKHGEAGLTRQRRVWAGAAHAQHVRDRGWGSHRHEMVRESFEGKGQFSWKPLKRVPLRIQIARQEVTASVSVPPVGSMKGRTG
jgi:hypothetical protein